MLSVLSRATTTYSPIIIVRPNPCDQLGEFARSNCQIRILLAVDGNLFPVEKTFPNRACLRSPSDFQKGKDRPTPFYNATIRSECCSLRYLGLLHRASYQSARLQTCLRSWQYLAAAAWFRRRSDLWRVRSFRMGLHSGSADARWRAT